MQGEPPSEASSLEERSAGWSIRSSWCLRIFVCPPGFTRMLCFPLCTQQTKNLKRTGSATEGRAWCKQVRLRPNYGERISCSQEGAPFFSWRNRLGIPKSACW
jgi:hypothetical protein